MSSRATIAELLAFLLVWGLILSFLPGCDTKSQVGQAPSATAVKPAANKPVGKPKRPAKPALAESTKLAAEQTPGALGGGSEEDSESKNHQPAETSAKNVPSFERPTRAVNEQAIAAAGLHKVEGKHLVLYTDLPVDDEIKVLPQVFDLAFSQWCDYFHLDHAKHANWQMRGTLIGDQAKFAGTGLLREDLPAFRNGFEREGELWLYEQPSVYYRRHLLLHEGTHGFMETLLGSAGPPWYMEGVAELLATHTWQDGQLKLNVMPANKEDFEMLGRIKIVQEDSAKAGHAKPLTEILNYTNRAHLENEPYGWCWAAAAFLDRHPQYQARFQEMFSQVQDPQFNRNFALAYQPDWSAMNTEWRLFASTLEHGHEIPATAIDFQPGVELSTGSHEVTIDSARGWQPSGVQLLAGQKYRLTASGRFQVAITTEPWLSEAGGVSIRYNRGQPLGMLLAAVVDLEAGKDQQLVAPLAIGLAGEITPEHNGTLYLQLNDSAGERADNLGTLQVLIAAE
jgi:hypothetical protein